MEKTIEKLRGHLQNCVNHLEMAKRKSHGDTQRSYDQCIQQANKCLYETLTPPKPAVQADALICTKCGDPDCIDCDTDIEPYPT